MHSCISSCDGARSKRLETGRSGDRLNHIYGSPSGRLKPMRGVRTENTRSPYGITRSPYGAMMGKSRTPHGLKGAQGA